jgi:hypothetical protein
VVSVSSPIASPEVLAGGNGKAEGPTNGEGVELSGGEIGGFNRSDLSGGALERPDDASICGWAIGGLVLLLVSGAANEPPI